jgi:hypothetical protein
MAKKKATAKNATLAKKAPLKAAGPKRAQKKSAKPELFC